MIIIETQRLLLREFTSNDADFILRILNTPSWQKFIGDKGVKTIHDALLYISDKILDSYAKNGFGLYCVALKNTTIPIGMCGLVKREGLEIPDIGFALLPDYEKKGYALEAARSVLDYAKDKLQINDIIALTSASNLNSILLLQKLGMSFKNLIWHPDDNNVMTMLFGFA